MIRKDFLKERKKGVGERRKRMKERRKKGGLEGEEEGGKKEGRP